MPDRSPRPMTFCCGILWTSFVILAGWLLPADPAGGSELRQTPIVRAVQRARPSIVNIRGEKTVPRSDSAPIRGEEVQRVNGMGTGVVIDSRGYILTNHHVVDGVREILVTSADGRQATAKLLAHDPETDLAIIKVEFTEELPAITWGTSSDLMPGEPVVAVGNAYGYEHTVTRGIISALNRAVQVSDAQFYDDLIQTDASINPGNSGGPLLNIDGEMVGINVAVRAGAQGIGFALPVDKAMAVAARLLDSRNARTAWHGVVLEREGGVSEEGVTVALVDRASPAAKSGLQAGDVITAVEGTQLKRNLDFSRVMLGRSAGEKVQLAVRRPGKSLDVELTLSSVGDEWRSAADFAWEVLGVRLEPVPAKEFPSKYRTSYRGGLSITAVEPSGPAGKRGVAVGDVLVQMDAWETVSVSDVLYVLRRPDFGSAPLEFYVLRGNQMFCGYLPAAVATALRP